MKLTNPDHQNGLYVDLVAQEWLKAGIGTDIKISCGTKQNRQSFHCHRFILINFIKKECGEASLEDEDLVILLPDTNPVEFSQYIEYAYGFKSSFWRNFDSNKTPKDFWGQRYLSKSDSSSHSGKNGEGEEGSFSPTKSEDQLLEVKLETDMDDNDNSFFNTDLYSDLQNDLVKQDVNFEIADQICPMNSCTYTNFKGFDELNLHLKVFHNAKNKPIVCGICKKICLRKTVYISHMRDAHFQHIIPDLKTKIKKVIRCKHCKEIFQDLTEKQQHIRQVHPEKFKKLKIKEINCPICKEMFTTKKDLKRHRMNVHGETRASLENPKPKEVLCPKCGEVFDNKKALRNHTSKVHGEGEQWNGKSETNGEERIRHKCFKCHKDFSHDKYLWLHIDDKHPEVRNPQTLLCNLCGATFTVRPKLNSHMEKFHMMGNKKYQCKYCDFRTLTSHVLMEHERTHTDERPEVCQWCGKGFKARKTLRNHERLHTGEKPFKCKFCDSAFVQRTSLNVHLQSHHKQDMLENSGEANPVASHLPAKPKLPLPYAKREPDGYAPPHHIAPLVSHLMSRESHMMSREAMMSKESHMMSRESMMSKESMLSRESMLFDARVRDIPFQTREHPFQAREYAQEEAQYSPHQEEQMAHSPNSTQE